MSLAQFEQHDRISAIIDQLAAADAWSRAAQSLDKGWAAFAAYSDRVKLESVTFGLLVAQLGGSPNYTGFGGIPGWIMTVYGEADDYNLARVEAVTVHELHHNVMGAVAGSVMDWNTGIANVTVGDYMIGEGLAESFATELYGADKAGPWITEFDETHLEATKALFREALHLTGFDTVRRYIFGDAEAGIAPTAGYAIGYRVVQAYLQRTGKGVVDASFVPAQEIIRESRFFDLS
jgi:uncharacterized protein YjaZ